MRQAIVTKYLGPTNARGSRVKAAAAAGSITVGWDDALNPEQNHLAAARALVARRGWIPAQGERYGGLWVGGSLPDGSLCWVFTGDQDGDGSAFDTRA